ncbi:cysteine desulfurase [Hyphomicrobiales bacterium]|jgi:cysteine desulfurase|nr:cysteine desulfurase [Rhodobiaceae bacterium]MDC0139819.1 cysteine desulfurase [Hyphomicrobiales bacterium]
MRVYLDNAATTPLRPEVSEYMITQLTHSSNASSVHQEGQQSRIKIEQSRTLISDQINCNQSTILFTSSGTEACNYVINFAKNKLCVDSIICLPTEHVAVLSPIENSNLNTTMCSVNSDGLIDLRELENILKKSSELKKLICVMAVNNETGIIQPIKEISNLCKKYNDYFFCDCIQALGKIPLDMENIGIDFSTFASHKIGGPQGVGVVYIGANLGNYSDIVGGGQEFGRRGGTENVLAISSFGKALEVTLKNLLIESDNITKLNKILVSGIKKVSSDIIIVAEGADKLGSIVSIIIPNIKSETIVIALDIEGFSVSAGAACSSGKVNSSHVLKAMGYDDNLSNSAIRISLGWKNTEEDIINFLNILNKLSKTMNF